VVTKKAHQMLRTTELDLNTHETYLARCRSFPDTQYRRNADSPLPLEWRSTDGGSCFLRSHWPGPLEANQLEHHIASYSLYTPTMSLRRKEKRCQWTQISMFRVNPSEQHTVVKPYSNPISCLELSDKCSCCTVKFW
jgi:hypothetical protein